MARDAAQPDNPMSMRDVARWGWAELAEDETSMTTANNLAIRQALEEAGIEFIDENGGGVGVRLRTKTGTKNKSVVFRLRYFGARGGSTKP